MESWRKRVLMFKVIGALPLGGAVMSWLRHNRAGLKNYDFSTRTYILDDFSRLLEGGYLDVEGASFVEIGGGWHPVLSLFLHGLGAERIVLTDIARHMRPQYVAQTIDFVGSHGADELAARGVRFDRDAFQGRLDALRGSESEVFDRMERVGMTYRAPLDFTHAPFADGEFDCVYSNSCLGYIPVPVLSEIFAEMSRVVKQNGVVVHSIHVYDDFCGDGSEIGPVNFLKYSADEWNRIGNSSIHHQSRLRPKDYVDLATGAGLTVEVEDRIFKRIPDFDVGNVELHPDFQGLPEDEIRCRNLFLVARKPVAQPVG